MEENSTIQQTIYKLDIKVPEEAIKRFCTKQLSATKEDASGE